MGMKMYSKSVRFPEDLAAFVEQQPGEDFSKKLVGVLREYRDGNERRQADIRCYDAQMGHGDYNVTRIYSQLAAESKMLGVDVYRLDPVFFRKGY